MASLSEQMKELAAKHSLNALSIHLHTVTDTGRIFFGANAHAGGICTQGSAETPEAALAAAINEINARRAPPLAVVPVLEQAA